MISSGFFTPPGLHVVGSILTSVRKLETILYACINNPVHVCNVWAGDEEKHYSLDLVPQDEARFCAFAARFSSDGSEIAAS
jgi:hypothetical protein